MKQMSDLGTKRENLPRILVMMGTYNGEKYVAQQIESILNQQNVEVYLLISDEGQVMLPAAFVKVMLADAATSVLGRIKKIRVLQKNFMDMLMKLIH